MANVRRAAPPSAVRRRVRRVVRHLTSESALSSLAHAATGSVPESALHAGHLVSQVLRAHGVEFVFCLSVRGSEHFLSFWILILLFCEIISFVAGFDRRPPIFLPRPLVSRV